MRSLGLGKGRPVAERVCFATQPSTPGKQQPQSTRPAPQTWPQGGRPWLPSIRARSSQK